MGRNTKRHALILGFVSLFIWGACSSGSFLGLGSRQHLKVVFYNVENLFDTLNTPGKRDGEFTPEGRNEWNSEKYWTKIHNLALVLDSIVGKKDAVIGLAEIESDYVLQDLCQALSGKWNYLSGDSPDARGIDVALLFRGDFTFQEMKLVEVTLIGEPNFKTRYIQFNRMLWGKEELLFTTAHFPSRRGGRKASEYKRVAAAVQLKHTLDSMHKVHSDAGVIIMGDFNDEPVDSSIVHGLGSGMFNAPYVNLMDSLDARGDGSYLYRGQWNMLDQMLVSRNLLDRKGVKLIGEASIYRKPWMLQQEGKYKGYPLRTFGGRTYLGGYSDHMPVWIELRK